jgi:hypothetical protein
MTRLTSGAALLTLAIAFFASRRAAAADTTELVSPAIGPCIPVTFEAHGQPLSVSGGDGDGTDCADGLLPRGSYKVRMGDAHDVFQLEEPAVLVYRPGHPRLAIAGLVMAIGGLAVGGLDAYAVVKGCGGHSCSAGDVTGLVAVGSVGFGAAVVGTIFYFAMGESIVMRPAASRRWQLDFGPASRGGTLGLHASF